MIDARYDHPGWLAMHACSAEDLRRHFGSTEAAIAAIEQADPLRVARRGLERFREEQRSFLPGAVAGFVARYRCLSRARFGRFMFDRGAFDRDIRQEPIALYVNHDDRHAYASTGDGTLRITCGPDGLYFRARLRNDEHGTALLRAIERGKATGASEYFEKVESEDRRDRSGHFHLITRAALIDEISITISPSRPAGTGTYVFTTDTF